MSGQVEKTHTQCEALPVICKLHIHRLKVICLFKFRIQLKSHIFFMNLKEKQTA